MPRISWDPCQGEDERCQLLIWLEKALETEKPKYILKYIGFYKVCFLINFKNEVPKCLKYDKHWRNRYF